MIDHQTKRHVHRPSNASGLGVKPLHGYAEIMLYPSSTCLANMADSITPHHIHPWLRHPHSPQTKYSSMSALAVAQPPPSCQLLFVFELSAFSVTLIAPPISPLSI